MNEIFVTLYGWRELLLVAAVGAVICSGVWIAAAAGFFYVLRDKLGITKDARYAAEAVFHTISVGLFGGLAGAFASGMVFSFTESALWALTTAAAVPVAWLLGALAVSAVVGGVVFLSLVVSRFITRPNAS
jgi:hypothetical protein